MRDLRSCSPISAMLTPSMKIFPFAASKILKIPRASEDFPAPVLPTIPTWKRDLDLVMCDITNFKQLCDPGLRLEKTANCFYHIK